MDFCRSERLYTHMRRIVVYIISARRTAATIQNANRGVVLHIYVIWCIIHYNGTLACCYRMAPGRDLVNVQKFFSAVRPRRAAGEGAVQRYYMVFRRTRSACKRRISTRTQMRDESLLVTCCLFTFLQTNNDIIIHSISSPLQVKRLRNG